MAARNDLLRITESVPASESSAQYNADLDLGQPTLAPFGACRRNTALANGCILR